MHKYEFTSPTRTYFGCNCVEDALKKEKSTAGERVLLVTTGGALEKLGFVDALAAMLEADVCIYNRISANPDVAEVREVVRLGKENRVSSVIGFGGGSSIDAAKAAAVGIVSDIDVETYLLDSLSLPENTLPVIAIPTTAGTGAELSRGAILSSREKGFKSGIRGDRIIPAAAIVDPVYTYSLPFRVTMEAGFDVFTHAAESFCAVRANPFSEMLSEKAIRIVGEALPRLAENPDDHGARDMMSFASHIMGYNVRDIGNCLPHRLQYPVGAATGTSHGAGLAALYPAWLRHESFVNPDRVHQILDWLGCTDGTDAGERIRKWLEKLHIDYSLSGLGNTLSAGELARRVTGDLRNDRLADFGNITETIYRESM